MVCFGFVWVFFGVWFWVLVDGLCLGSGVLVLLGWFLLLWLFLGGVCLWVEVMVGCLYALM